jgi:hypothetical protein
MKWGGKEMRQNFERRINALESKQPTEDDFRQTLQWPAYRDTLLKELADYPQKGLLQDVQRAFDDLESRSGLVKDSDIFYAIDPILRKHFEEFAPNPHKADYLAIIARFKAVGASDEDLADVYKYVRKYQAEDEYRISGKCAGCGVNVKEAPHSWVSRWREDELKSVPFCSDCRGSNR